MTYFVYGNYTHPDGEVNLVSHTKSMNLSPRRKSVSKTVRMVLMGHICAASQSTLEGRIEEILEAYKYNNRDAVLYLDDDSASSHAIYNSQTLDGVRVMSVDFPTGSPGELATGRTYRIVLEATLPAIEDQIMYWTQTVQHIGTGGSRIVLVPTRLGVPIPMITADRTPMTIVQHGNSIGMDAWTPVGAPMFPQYEAFDMRRISYSTPRLLANRAVQQFPAAWSYTFRLPIGLGTLVTPSFPT